MTRLTFAAIIMASALILSACPTEPGPADSGDDLPIQLFKQCDPAWGNDLRGTSGQTVCQVGALMASIGMMLSSEDAAITPGTLNAFLSANSGYQTGTALLFLNAIDAYPGTTYFYFEKPAFSLSRLKQELDLGKSVPLSITAGAHWVLVVSYSGAGSVHEDFQYYDPGAGPDSAQTLTAADNPVDIIVYRR